MRRIPVFVLFAGLFFSAPVAADEPLVVSVVTTQSSVSTRNIALTGEIVARDALALSFPSGGRIDSIDVHEGDVVEAGAILVRITSIQQEQALRAARAGVSTATADRDQADEDLRRQEALLERGATTRVARDAAADQTRVKEGVLAQAQADLELAEKALEDATIVAPQAATVTARLAEPGQVVGAVQPVVELALGGAVDAVFEVPESLFTGTTSIGGVSLAPLDHPDQIFSGTVREVSPLVDPATGTVAVKVQIDEKPSGVEYGDPIRGTTTEAISDRIVLPYRAMSASRLGPAVWVVDPETMRVSLQQITVDRFETGNILVSDGLADGVLVVTAGAQLLYPGRLVQAQAETNQ
ncbi:MULTISPECIES: efflux RND transporter periplasmic adaptor subunit [Rhodobacterales]|uniref:efflux RND transporter periplasmic adaptor subunit n=1 Tax=Rhodobacterales TaxID=204455 RepID=UPI0015F0A2B3|nr:MULTISPECIES: efflux RND transporter periplasmic adaptor subunit [Rhodobacterales]MDO6591199.1 efflux RND transporter periplasmic adaptor subunit [Yoonia sp. 1_MG-2023]